MFGLREGVCVCVSGGGRGMGKPKFVHLKWASHFWLPVQNFIFPQRIIFLVLFGWVVWSGGGGVRQINPPPPVDKHIPTRETYHW